MKCSTLAYVVAACAAAALTGCVVAPAYPDAAYGAPAGVVYVAPTYAMPAVGYTWRYHARYGWGWHHSGYGWHRGWR